MPNFSEIFNLCFISTPLKNIAIIGSGPASLILAAMLDPHKYTVTIYERNNAPARKFLVAGKGGFNLTHSEPKEEMLKKYIPFQFLEKALFSFDNERFRNWLKNAGIDTYVGTSKRVFPVKGIKPIEVLNAVMQQLEKRGVRVKFNHSWKGWNSKSLVFETAESLQEISNADIVIFALGGASWKVTGSDGSWSGLFEEKGIKVNPFLPSNCAFKINWNVNVVSSVEGQVIKNAVFSCGGSKKKGEAVLTTFGIEGSGVYALSNEIRKQLQEKGTADLQIDFKPDLEQTEIEARLKNANGWSVKDVLLKKIHLSEPQIALLKNQTTKEEYTSPGKVAALIKSFSVQIAGTAPLDDAISTAGGIDLGELNETYELKKMPGTYCIGEMLDWDAPTGGYLLQACVSMGYFLAEQLNKKD